MPGDAYHHGQLRSALLEAAGRLVEEKGAMQVSLREIARVAGVSHAAPYHHFSDREALLAELATDGFHALGDSLRRGAGGTAESDSLAKLQGAGVAYVRFAVENPEVYRLMFGALLSDRSRHPRLQAAADAAFGVLLDLMEGRRGETGPVAMNPVALATWSTVHGLASLLIEGLLSRETESVPAEEIARQATTVLGRGLQAYG
jgi:AcrR family transcriptional regulator